METWFFGLKQPYYDLSVVTAEAGSMSWAACGVLNFRVDLMSLAQGLLRTQEASKTPHPPVKSASETTTEWTCYVVLWGADDSKPKPTLCRFGMHFLVHISSKKNT